MASSLNIDRKISIAKMRENGIFFISKLEIFKLKTMQKCFPNRISTIRQHGPNYGSNERTPYHS